MAVVDRIFAHALATPDKTALIYDEATVNYGNFAQLIARVRRFLAGQPIVGDRVAILCVDNVLDGWVVGLALRSLGLTTVHGRGAEAIAQLGFEHYNVVTVESEFWPGLVEAVDGRPIISVPISIFSSPAPVSLAEEARALQAPGGHILLSSGTTGTHKKILIDTANEERNVLTRAAVLDVTAASLVNVFNMPGWTSIGYQWPVCAWTLGAGVVLHNGPMPHKSFGAPGQTHALVHPHLLAHLVHYGAQRSLRNDKVALIVGGGALPTQQWRDACELLSGDVRTIIGATEVGTFTITPIRSAEDLQWHRVHPSAEVQVVDDEDRPLPPGETGMLRIRTTGVSDYLDDPTATEAFFRDGYFYSGDLAILRADGRLSLQGRFTDVINAGGYKMASAPLEADLQERLGVAGVCLFSILADGVEQLHAAIQSDTPIPKEAITAALGEFLPERTRVRLHFVADLPRNQMGKIQRSALKAQLGLVET